MVDKVIDLSAVQLKVEIVQPLGEHISPCPCVRTDSFPLLKQNFSHYNPMQSKFLVVMQNAGWQANTVISSPTASGKTVISETCMALANNQGKKGIALVPLRALAQEKYDDWTSLDHDFFDREVVILTGDYSQEVSDERLKKADIIVMTSEALDHRSRFIKKNEWLMNVGMVVVDEAHLLTLDTRGDRLETCMMRFANHNKDTRFALLSATMPNVKDLQKWLDNITRRETVMVESDYRPCKLTRNYTPYHEFTFKEGPNTWEKNEQQRMELCKRLIDKYPEDQWIVFAGGKKFGRDAVEYFKEFRINSKFVSADDDKDARNSIVNAFKNGDIRVLVSTSLLAYGLNLPARRVLIPHVKRGPLDIATCDLLQMEGRSGRPKYDKEGTAYYLIPENDFFHHRKRIEQGENIVSRLNSKSNLMFHVVAEIYNREIVDVETLRDWFSRSLAKIQTGDLMLDDAEKVLEALETVRAIEKDEQGRYSVTNLGKVCAWYYQSPQDVFGWWSNFHNIFDIRRGKFDDALLAWALSNVDTWKAEYVSKTERIASSVYLKEISGSIDDASLKYIGGGEKWGACIYNMLQGNSNVILRSNESTVLFDLDRMFETLKGIDDMYGQWHKKEFFDTLKLRLRYKVKEEMVGLVKVKWVGGKVAGKLFEKGIKTVEDFVHEKNVVPVKEILKSRYSEAVQSAQQLLRR